MKTQITLKSKTTIERLKEIIGDGRWFVKVSNNGVVIIFDKDLSKKETDKIIEVFGKDFYVSITKVKDSEYKRVTGGEP